AGRRDPLRRRHVGRRGRDPGGRSGLQRRRVDRPGGARPRARGRPGLALRAHPGGRSRPVARVPARRARPHPAPLSAVVRVLHARRQDRHPRRRPFRHRVDPHRGPGRVRARHHPDRGLGVAAAVPGFESSVHPAVASMARALELCSGYGGIAPDTGQRDDGGAASGGDAVSSWRDAFLGAPYLRDVLVAAGILAETFETAITWERFPAFHEGVIAAAEQAVAEVCGEGGRVFCRFTHVYPDGPAPYFTVLARARRGEEPEQWAAIKRAVSDAIIDLGGTITHHHAVGRDHRPWYDRQRPEPFAAALRGAKAAIDPAGIMNPGGLIDPLS